jgi:beta-lactamase regulating signal transducer with metallopeptidase domain
MTEALALIVTTSGRWWSWMVPMAWQVCVLALVVWAVTALLRKRSPHLRYWLWMLVLVRLLLPPTLSLPTGIGNVVQSPRAIRPEAMRQYMPGESAVSASSPVRSGTSTPTPPAESPQVEVSLYTWLFLVWTAGALAMVGLLLAQYRRVTGKLRAAQTVTDPALIDLLDECRVLMGVRRQVPLLLIDELSSPVLFGTLRPRIALPRSAIAGLSPQQLKPILLHELAHLKRGDPWLNWVQFLAQAAYWYNPFVYLAGWCMRRERELIADDRVLHCLGGASEDYSSSLLHVVKQSRQRWYMAPGLVGIGEDGAEVTERVKRIMDSNRKLHFRFGIVSALVVAVAALILIPQARGKGWSFMARNANRIVFDIPKLEGITIDGNADDWGNRGFKGTQVGVRGGAVIPREELDVAFRLGWTDEGLAFLIAVQAPAFIESESQEYYQRDGVEMFIADSVGGKELVQVMVSPGVSPQRSQLAYRVFDYMRSEDMRSGVPARATVARQTVPGGYTMEVLLPWDMVGVTPAPGHMAGFQFSVGSWDEKNGLGRAMWYPVHGAHANSALTHALRLAGGASDPENRFAAVQTEAVARDRVRWDVACDNHYAGKPVVIRMGGKVVAKSVLQAGTSAASASCVSTFGRNEAHPGLAQILVDGRVAAVALPENPWAVYLEPQVDMPPPRSEPGNFYAHGMSAILSHLGVGITYERILGLTGVAFILQVDTSGPYLPEHGLDCAWWPNDDWGFELGLPVLSQAAGWDLRRLHCDVEAYRADSRAEYLRAFAPAIEKSLHAGKPVLADGFVITGMDEHEPPLMGYTTNGTSTEYSQKVRRMVGPPAQMGQYPWLLYVAGEKVAPGSADEVDLTSLRHAIALYDEQAQGHGAPSTRLSGRKAWAAWLDLLSKGVGHDNNMLIHLRYNRSSAIVYLEDMALRHTGTAEQHLRSAITAYRRIMDLLNAQPLPYMASEDVLNDYSTMVRQVSELESEAISELRKAADAMS